MVLMLISNALSVAIRDTVVTQKCISKLLEIISYYPEGFRIRIRIVDFKWIS